MALSLAVGPTLSRAQTETPSVPKGLPPVVVELFTSQGCSSCPPAEAYLGDLAQRGDVIALEFHVDYWDYIGWPDPFGQAAYTARQRLYGERLDQRYIYTPQMVIDGAAHAIGSRRGAVEAEIATAQSRRQRDQAAGRTPNLSVTPTEDGGITVELGGPAPGGDAYEVVLVGYDERRETLIKRGENAGKTLANHHIVRAVTPLGAWQGGRLRIPVSASALGWDASVILLQRAGQGPIAAAEVVRF
jgi:hypothetical protein